MTAIAGFARRWDADEIAWGRECMAAGDTVEEIAEMAGCAPAEVIQNLGRGPRLTENQRLVLRLYAAGETVRAIGRAIKADSNRPDSLATCYLRRLRDKGLPLKPRTPGRSPDQEARRHG